jgi:hypothetical protein
MEMMDVDMEIYTRNYLERRRIAQWVWFMFHFSSTCVESAVSHCHDCNMSDERRTYSLGSTCLSTLLLHPCWHYCIGTRSCSSPVPSIAASHRHLGYIIVLFFFDPQSSTSICEPALDEAIKPSHVYIWTLLTSRRSGRVATRWSTRRHTWHTTGWRERHTSWWRTSAARRSEGEGWHSYWRASAHGWWWEGRHVGRHAARPWWHTDRWERWHRHIRSWDMISMPMQSLAVGYLRPPRPMNCGGIPGIGGIPTFVSNFL